MRQEVIIKIYHGAVFAFSREFSDFRTIFHPDFAYTEEKGGFCTNPRRDFAFIEEKGEFCTNSHSNFAFLKENSLSCTISNPVFAFPKENSLSCTIPGAFPWNLLLPIYHNHEFESYAGNNKIPVQNSYNFPYNEHKVPQNTAILLDNPVLQHLQIMLILF